MIELLWLLSLGMRCWRWTKEYSCMWQNQVLPGHRQQSQMVGRDPCSWLQHWSSAGYVLLFHLAIFHPLANHRVLSRADCHICADMCHHRPARSYTFCRWTMRPAGRGDIHGHSSPRSERPACWHSAPPCPLIAVNGLSNIHREYLVATCCGKLIVEQSRCALSCNE